MDYRSKLAILQNARKLKGTEIYIKEDFSERVRKIRQALWRLSLNQRKNASTIRLQYDSLLIDNVRYVLNEAGDSIIKTKKQTSAANET